jgi:hypothetical protein
LQDPASVQAVQEECSKRIDKLFEQYREKINEMPSSRREQYARIGRQGADPRAETIHPPEIIEVRKETPSWGSHLFVDGPEKFGWNVNKWEAVVLREQMKGKDLAAGSETSPRSTGLCAYHTDRAKLSPCTLTCSCSDAKATRLRSTYSTRTMIHAPMQRRRRPISPTSLADMAVHSAESK